jgi:hypothetical protein
MMFPSANWDRERISTMDLLATFAQISEGLRDREILR